ncbi:hypothetical protein FISHEDRAFT_60636 [Fistulina hepatica ATCC 64428]|uniref:Uncharacterized protein n=1 Tax=Fistulina hepatica ATCC 64428 TaxID=1128425 RepID=A0A0D7A5R0_9AGAR|nr:hypothetical protein FISHEDRAFT_60636 [Fistulina hepatica ATCC 64428]
MSRPQPGFKAASTTSATRTPVHGSPEDVQRQARLLKSTAQGISTLRGNRTAALARLRKFQRKQHVWRPEDVDNAAESLPCQETLDVPAKGDYCPHVEGICLGSDLSACLKRGSLATYHVFKPPTTSVCPNVCEGGPPSKAAMDGGEPQGTAKALGPSLEARLRLICKQQGMLAAMKDPCPQQIIPFLQLLVPRDGGYRVTQLYLEGLVKYDKACSLPVSDVLVVCTGDQYSNGQRTPTMLRLKAILIAKPSKVEKYGFVFTRETYSTRVISFDNAVEIIENHPLEE